jgi:hypothetical protein
MRIQVHTKPVPFQAILLVKNMKKENKAGTSMARVAGLVMVVVMESFL